MTGESVTGGSHGGVVVSGGVVGSDGTIPSAALMVVKGNKYHSFPGSATSLQNDSAYRTCEFATEQIIKKETKTASVDWRNNTIFLENATVSNHMNIFSNGFCRFHKSTV